VIATFFVRAYLRFKHTPIVNPTVIAAIFVIVLGFFIDFPLFISWSGVNYSYDIGNFRIPFGTIISCLLAFILILLTKKIRFA
jgi:hypothetical protein